MVHYILIGIVILVIVIIQFWIFRTNLKKIALFKSIFPPASRFKTIGLNIPENKIGKLSYGDIRENYGLYTSQPNLSNLRSFSFQIKEETFTFKLSEFDNVLERYKNEDYKILLAKDNRTAFIEKDYYDKFIQNGWSIYEKNIDLVPITLIQNLEHNNDVLDKIITSVNTYLLRNKGAVSDFNLVKDIVERNCDSEDEQINTLLPIPLYLGLMGTMLGIIVGVGYMAINGFDSFLTSTIAKTAGSVVESNGSNGIIVLMGAVGVAMISSFIGLLLTTIASGWFYKGAKSQVEGLKNDFYTFIQTELLPSISNSATNSIVTLQNNLLKFNEGFTSNIVRFDGLLTQILSSFNNQMSIVHDLKDIDVAKIARFNIEVLKELRLSTLEFEKFNQYIHQVNALVSNASELNTTLKSDLADLDNRKYTVQQAFTKVNDSFEKGLIILKESTDDRLRDVKRTTDKQQDTFEKYLENSKLVLKEIIDKEKGLLIDQLDQNEQILNELKKQSELRQSLEKVGYAITSQNKVLSEQNKTLANFGQSAEELNKAVKKLLSIQNSSNNGTFNLPPFARYLGYAFAIAGIAAFIAVMVFIGGRTLSDPQIKESITKSTALKPDETSGLKQNATKQGNFVDPSGKK